MRAIHHHAWNRRAQHSGDELRVSFPATSTAASGISFTSTCSSISQAAASGSTNTACSSLTPSGTMWRIFQRQRYVLCVGAGMADDAQYRPPRTMRLQSTPAKIADRPPPEGPAGNIDFAATRRPSHLFFSAADAPRNRSNRAHEFMPRNAPEVVIAAQQFHVGVADAHQPHAYKRPLQAEVLASGLTLLSVFHVQCGKRARRQFVQSAGRFAERLREHRSSFLKAVQLCELFIPQGPIGSTRMARRAGM